MPGSGWDARIPEEAWPDALLAAVRRDLRALRSRRVIETLARWRSEAELGPEERRREATAWLEAVGRALLPHAAGDDIPTAFIPRPAPDLAPSEDRVDTDSAARAFADGETVDAFAMGPPSGARPRPVLRPAAPRRRPKLELGGAAPADISDAPTRALEPEPEPLDTSAIVEAYSAEEEREGPFPDGFHDGSEHPTTAVPRPPTIDVSKSGASPSPSRPRAAVVQVRALFGAIRAFCDELVPLNPERRSRRFWTHWRDISGGAGVRREHVEDILRRADGAEAIASELIAEVYGVDLASVREIVARLATETAPPRAEPAPDRGPKPLVGESLGVEPRGGD